MNYLPGKLVAMLYNTFIKPLGSDADSRRREFILNTLLSALLAMATALLPIALINSLARDIDPGADAAWVMVFFWVITGSLLLISRKGKPRVAAMFFSAFLLAVCIQFALLWGFHLAQTQLVFALTVVIVGVLFRGPMALTASLVIIASLVIVAYLQVHHLQQPYIAWDDGQPEFFDVVGYAVIFMAIGLVSWLSNRETDRSLRRARRSEAALQKERDNLEIKIAERTRDLEELQAARLLELQPYIEFGRIGAGLVHDIANPLTAATLHLEELDRQQHSELVRQVQRNLQQLEKYLLAARKQIKRESDLRVFSVGAELRQIVRLLAHRARRVNTQLVVEKIGNIRLYGDAVKFDQLIANLIANAIDACEGVPDVSRRVVTVSVSAEDEYVVIAINDRGAGITAAQMNRLFEPFYSTKSSARKGLGIGLSLVKQYVEYDFRGSIHVSSAVGDSTTFTLRLRNQDRA